MPDDEHAASRSPPRVASPQGEGGEARGAGRLVFLDNIRVFLAVDVFIFHVTLQYAFREASHDPLFVYGELLSSEALLIVAALYAGLHHAYCMPLYFFLAGALTPASARKRSRGAYLQDRLLRLGIPALAYLLIIFPAMMYSKVVYYDGFEGSFWAYYPVHLTDPQRFGVSVMWFPPLLLIFSVVYAWSSMTGLAAATSGPRLTNRVLLAFGAAVALVTMVVRVWSPLSSVRIPFFHIEAASLPMYIAMFALGVSVGRFGAWPGFFADFGRRWLVVATGMILLLPVLMVTGGGATGGVKQFMGGLHWQSAVYVVWETTVAISLMVAIPYLFERHLDRMSRVTRLLRTHTFAFYVLHPMILLALGHAFSSVPVPVLAKAGLVILLGMPLTLALSHFVVRRLPLVDRVLYTPTRPREVEGLAEAVPTSS